MVKTNILPLVITLIIIIMIILWLNKSCEGFYSNNSINNAKTTLNDVLSTQLNGIITVFKDVNTNKYNLDITSAIGSLGEEMKNSSEETILFITKKKKELSNLQKNMNNINKILGSIPNNGNVEQIVLLEDETSIKTYNLLDALNNINTQLHNITNQLSEIPE